MMPEKQLETEEEAAAPPEGEGEGGQAGAKEGRGSKPRRTHGERALVNIRSAKRTMQEAKDSDPGDRAEYLLAEANVLALLDLADALRGPSKSNDD